MRAISKVVFGAVASLLLGSSAMAADLMAPPPPDVAMTSSADWTGLYLGLGATYRTVSPAPTYSDDVASLILGANFQSGMFLVGLDGRVSYSYENDNAYQQWEWGVRGRAGFVLGDAALVYAAVGYEDHLGSGNTYYQFGVGAEFMVTDNVSLDLAYTHSIGANSGNTNILDDVTGSVLWHFR